MRQLIGNLLSGAAPPAPIISLATPSLTIPEQLKERIQKDAESYGTLEDAVKMFDFIKGVMDSFQLPDPIADLFTLRRTFMSEQYGVPNAKAIGEWLQNNPGDFFARVLVEIEEYDTEEMFYPRTGMLSAFSSVYPQSPQFRTVTKERTVISGFDSSEKIPLKAVHLVAEPKLQNLPWWKWYCAFIVSKTQIRCFLTDVRLKEINWQERQEQGKIEWRIRTLPLKDMDVVRKHVDEMLDQFAEAITKYLMEKYGLSDGDHTEPSAS